MPDRFQDFVARHFSVGDLISLVLALFTIGAAWQKLDTVAKDVQGLKQEASQRSITDSRVSALEYRVANAERDRLELKTDIAERLRNMDSKLDALIRERAR